MAGITDGICRVSHLKYRVKRPLLVRVPSLARFFDDLTEITCVKEQVVEFFSLKLSTLLCDVVVEKGRDQRGKNY